MYHNGIADFRDVAAQLASFGREGDLYIVHAAEGETVVPLEVLDKNPKLKELLFQQMREMDLEPERYVVGNKLNSINPVTGQPEFFFKNIFSNIKNIFSTAAPVIGAIAGSFIPGVGSVIGPALGSFAASKLSGRSTTDSLLNAALAGTAGYLAGNSAAAQAGGFDGGAFSGGSGSSLGSAIWNGVGSQGIGSLFQGANPGVTAAPTGAAGTVTSAAAPTANAGAIATNAVAPSGGGSLTMAGAGDAGALGNIGAATGSTAAAPAAAKTAQSSMFGGIGNWIKENPLLAAGIGVGGLYAAGAFDPPKPTQLSQNSVFRGPTSQQLMDENPARYKFDANKFLPNGPNYIPPYYKTAKAGGHIEGPGSGTSDSIPAMLSDGEFVFTAKAVRGAGEGNRMEGAKRMYQMMREFEGRA
jgi:hypothetical protein